MNAMACSTPRFAHLAAAALALAAGGCVAKSSDTLGELDDASTSAGPDGSDGSGDSSADDAPTADSGDPPPLTCEPGLTFAEPASCPQALGLPLPEPGCFEACTGEGAACAVGECHRMEHNPCPCPPDAAECCGACTAEIWLCVQDVVDPVCDAIVGATFETEAQCPTSQEDPPPKDPELGPCRTVTFQEDGSYLWLEGDFGMGGDYLCVDGLLEIPEGFAVAYDPQTGVLTWEGEAFFPSAG